MNSKTPSVSLLAVIWALGIIVVLTKRFLGIKIGWYKTPK